MNIYEIEEDELFVIKFSSNPDKYIEYYYEIINSNISILRVYNSICKNNNKNVIIKPRINDNYYCSCIFHYASDLPLRIIEKEKLWCCYGCGQSGSLITLVSKYYEITIEESLEVFHSYLTKDTSILNKEQLMILKEIFEHYNSKNLENIFKESKRKTNLLNTRIKNYIKNRNISLDENIISKRLCCSKKYARTISKNNK